MTGDREISARRAAHRAALDHVLGLVAGAEWSASLVLRGSMSMCAWAAFTAEHPQVHGTAREWLRRLGTALAPMLTVHDETR